MAATPQFDNSYARLPEPFYHRQQAATVPRPALIRLNEGLAHSLGLDLDWLRSPAGLDMLCGNALPTGADPIATVYAGHQFGSWNPQLGDGRALLIGEILAPDGRRYDLQLKGSGRTPYSRGGDGKSPLGPVLREYLVSEAMHALGIPTTRSLAAVSTGETVYRDEALPGAILTRVASSHIRVGTVQFFSSRRDEAALQTLCEHVIARHFPSAAEADNPIQALLDQVVAAQAELIARWQLVGFIHGVMNTDNMLLCGETIDYGPCAFMDSYDPATVFSSIDHGGRYAYGNQPSIAHWNLAALAQALLPLLHSDPDTAVKIAQTTVDSFPQRFIGAYQTGMAAKLGIGDYRDGDDDLVKTLLELMHSHRCDFTLCFRRLTELAGGDGDTQSLFTLPEAFEPWLQNWQQRRQQASQTADAQLAAMQGANPLFIPRNHRVEQVINAAVEQDDLAPFHALVELLAKPFDYRADQLDYARPPEPDEQVPATFCGT